MAKDYIAQFVKLRRSLLSERERLEKRLQQINVALGEISGGGLPAARPEGKPVRRLARNAMSLKDAALKVTKEKPMTRKEVLKAVLALGYKFTSTNPLNSLGVVLYNKSHFKRVDGKFAPAK